MWIFQIIGIVVVGLIVIFLILLLFYALFKKEALPVMSPNNMPELRPLPIPTKNRNVLMRILVWLFEVRQWELLENWYFKLENGDEIILHQGFIFDGASIPRPFWFFLSPVGLLLIPGLIHDYGYKYNQLWQKDENGQIIPYMQGVKQAQWDQLFWEVGEQVNGLALVDFIAWLAVKLGGRFAWNPHRAINAPPIKPT